MGPAQIRVLSPVSGSRYSSDNNFSCVLQVQVFGRHILLTGDIESETEMALMARYPDLKSDLIVVPHHGSRSSSSYAFLRALDPDVALNSSGYLNRFHFPHPEIVERYRELGIEFYDTADSGAIEVQVNPGGDVVILPSRQQNPALWRRN